MAKDTNVKDQWTEVEKLKVLFSLIPPTINWKASDIYIPPGRSIKAVKCMIDVMKRKMKEDGITSGSVAGTPVGRGRVKNVANGEADEEGGCVPGTPCVRKTVAKGKVTSKRKRVALDSDEFPVEEGNDSGLDESPAKMVKTEDHGGFELDDYCI